VIDGGDINTLLSSLPQGWEEAQAGPEAVPSQAMYVLEVSNADDHFCAAPSDWNLL
jgi:hypothetical protein